MKIHFFKSFFYRNCFLSRHCVWRIASYLFGLLHISKFDQSVILLFSLMHMWVSATMYKEWFSVEKIRKILLTSCLRVSSTTGVLNDSFRSADRAGPGQRTGGRPFVFASRQWQATTPTYFLTLPHLQSCDSSCCCVGVRAMPWPSTSRHRFSWQLSQRIFTYFARGSLIVSMISCFTCLDAATLLVFN